jgi:hypothetical protein
MKGTVLRLEPPAARAAVVEAEPIEAAVRELSTRVAENNAARRRLFSRLDELRGLTPGLRRRHARPSPPAMTAPVNFFSIEEADFEAPAPRQVARGGR